MPLVVPNTTADQRSDWAGKLLGKKLGDKHDEVTFAKQDLPQKHRVIQPDGMATADFDQNRLNIHVDKDGTVHDVKHG